MPKQTDDQTDAPETEKEQIPRNGAEESAGETSLAVTRRSLRQGQAQELQPAEA